MELSMLAGRFGKCYRAKDIRVSVGEEVDFYRMGREGHCNKLFLNRK